MFYEFLRDLLRRPILRYAVIAYTVAALVVVVVQYYSVTPRVTLSQIEYFRHELSIQVEELRRQFQKELQVVASGRTEIIKDEDLARLTATLDRLNRLSDDKLLTLLSKVTELEQETVALSVGLKNIQSALNPTKPEEVLTLVRLGDKVASFTDKLTFVESEFEKFEKDVGTRIQAKFNDVDSQVDRLYGIIQWLGLLVLPAILNTVRDILTARRKDTPETPQGSNS